MIGASKKAVQSLARYGIFVALAVEFILFAALEPSSFLSLTNQINVLKQNASVAVLAIGMTFVILTAGIDLSVGSLMAVAAIACSAAMPTEQVAPALSVLLAVGVGLTFSTAAGLGSGLVITKVKVVPFIATLAMLTIARGAVLHYTDSRTIKIAPETFLQFDSGWGPLIVLGLVFGGALFTLKATAFGRHVYAVGGNLEAARLCGIRVDWVLIRVYMLSGLLAGIAGVLETARLGSGIPKTGELRELDAIAAVVVGGTSLMGGRGSLVGTLAGALVIAWLNNFLNLRGVPFYSQKIVIGLVLISAAFLDRFRTER